MGCVRRVGMLGQEQRERIEVRFFNLVAMEPNTGCWLWLGKLCPTGYGIFVVFTNYHMYAHLVAFELFREPMAPDLESDHLCRTRSCVNPWHIEAVTHRENMMRSKSHIALNSSKTTCVKGHPYDSENTYVYSKNGGRQCRTCHRDGQRNRRRKLQERKE